MSTRDVLVWAVLPYISIVTFTGGLIWRYRTDQFGWTSRSSSWNEHAILRWSSPMFHLGIIAVALGHLMGLVIPHTWTTAIGISPHMYHLVATVGGSIAALVTLVGFIGLLYRRLVVRSVRVTTTASDIVVYVGLAVVMGLGTAATTLQQVLGGPEGYNYRETISIWYRSVLLLHPRVDLIATAPVVFQLHIVAAMLFFCVWPFTRLVHVLSAPVGYSVRPYVVYRSREQRRHPVAVRRGWE